MAYCGVNDRMKELTVSKGATSSLCGPADYTNGRRESFRKAYDLWFITGNVARAGYAYPLHTYGRVPSSKVEEIEPPPSQDLTFPLKHTEIKAAETTKAEDLHSSKY